MKNPLLTLCAVAVTALTFSCDSAGKMVEEEATATNYSYSVAVNLSTEANNAPALQSFAHARVGNDWILFAGRTNRSDTLIGGLHGLDSNYTNTSFLPRSFNNRLYYYNPVSNPAPTYIDMEFFIELIKKKVCPIDTTGDCDAYVDALIELFNNTNPLVTQDDEYVYLLGGYGPQPGDDKTYLTYNRIVKMHLQTLSMIVKGQEDEVDNSIWNDFIRVGIDTSNSLVSTGGELFKIGDTFYMAGGHNFGKSAPNFQKYVDAVYPFTLEDEGLLRLSISVGTAISDVPDPKAASADNESKFRRRDGPIVPALFRDAQEEIQQGLTFYAGVFMPGPDTNLKAWNTAIYVHPIRSVPAYTIDDSYNQNNFNVYACANFVAFDPTNGIVHTFLLGGIGDGKISSGTTLSSFTNTGAHIQFNINSNPLSSSFEIFKHVYGETAPPFYGAEAIFFMDENAEIYFTPDGNATEILDLSRAFGEENSITIGYIYGGIEAFQADPGTFGQGNSAASNKVWEVTLSRTAN